MTNNLFTDLPEELSDELLTTLLEVASARIERIVSHGHVSPEGFWYDQDEHEWVIILKGAARVRFEDRPLEMKPGDFVNIPAHKKHRVEWHLLLVHGHQSTLKNARMHSRQCSSCHAT